MDLYSSASMQRPEELSGGATPPPPKAAITEWQVLGQTRAEKVVPEQHMLLVHRLKLWGKKEMLGP
jgi:hypothetical protein